MTRLRGERGFTLAELMVVIVIVGLLSAVAILAMPDPNGGLTAEAERFAARAQAAHDFAITGSRSVAIRLGPGSYSFERRSGGGWQPLDERPFREQAWREGVSATVGGRPAGRIVFDSTGSADPALLLLQRGREQARVEVQADGTIDVAS